MKRSKPSHTPTAPSLSQLKSLKKPLTPTSKKKLSKQSPSKNPTKTPPQDYIIINDNIYSANTFTERHSYEQFLHKVKREKQVERRSFLVKSQVKDESGLRKRGESRKKERGWKKLSPQDFIQSMSLQEKKEMFFKLQQDIRSTNKSKPSPTYNLPCDFAFPSIPCHPSSSISFQPQPSPRDRLDSERERRQKFSLLEQKLQNYKLQLMFKWEGQVDRLEEMYRQNKITQKEKDTKVAIIEKLKEHKLKILDCTRTLFEKILKEEEFEQEHLEEKANKIDAILKSLHSFPSLENIDQHYAENEPSIGHLKVKDEPHLEFSPHKNLNFDSSPLEIVEDNHHEAFLNDFRDGGWDRSNSKSVEDLKSPLSFLNNSSQKGRFAEYEDSQQGSCLQQKLPYPCNPLFAQKQQIVSSGHIVPVTKPVFEDEGEKISLKLDLRLDEVVFGQDEYPQCEKEDLAELKPEGIQDNLQPQKELEINFRVEALVFQQSQVTEQSQPNTAKFGSQQQQNQQEKNPSLEPIPPPVSPPKVQKISLSKLSFSPETQPEDELTCKQKPSQKTIINIPMILSRQKMETLAFEQNRAFRQNLDNHIAFQMGCIELQPPSPSCPLPFHFTTLVDINTYIVGFYEFMMSTYQLKQGKYMGSLVDNLNIPYGKSAIDKLYSLQAEGFVIEESYNEMNNILSESHFVEYQREIMFTMRKCTEHQTAHNRAVFEAFTKCINVYRPYFDLEGEVFPWIVSEKGITFYEITEDNIEQVFQKSKIKVLEYCTSLCGLHPPFEVKNEQQSALMGQKNEQNLIKTIKTEVLEQFEQWKIRFVNFECLVRMLVTDKVYGEVLNEIVVELASIEQANNSG